MKRRHQCTSLNTSMAQKASSTSIVKTKIDLVQTQGQELCELLHDFIEKEVAAASVVDSGKLDLNAIRVTSTRLDVVLEFLLQKCADVDDFTSGSVVGCKQQQMSCCSDSPHLLGPNTALELALSMVRQNEEEKETKVHKLGNFKKMQTDSSSKEKEHSSSIIKSKETITFCENTSCSERIGNIEVHLQYLSSRIYRLSKKSNPHEGRDLIKQVEAECDDIKSSLQKNETDAAVLWKTSVDLASQLGKFRNEFGTGMALIDDLSSKVDASELILRSFAARLFNNEYQISELQDRIQVIGDHRNVDLDCYKGKLEDVESLYKQVCQMIASQVKPLVHLKDVLCKYHHIKELQEEAAMQTSTIPEDVDGLSPETGRLGSKRRVPVGFTAYWGDYTHVPGDVTLIFNDVLCNEGNCYSATTGHFTAPYNGLYLTSLTLRQKDNGRVEAQVRLAQSRHFVGKTERTVCKSLTTANNESCSDTGVVWMKAGDNLHVGVVGVECKPRLSFYSSFSCILIG